MFSNNMDELDPESLSALHCAVKSGSSDTIQFLINAGADMNVRTGCAKSITPAMLAASLGETTCLKKLIGKWYFFEIVLAFHAGLVYNK